jgi:hypothetical protein
VDARGAQGPGLHEGDVPIGPATEAGSEEHEKEHDWNCYERCATEKPDRGGVPEDPPSYSSHQGARSEEHGVLHNRWTDKAPCESNLGFLLVREPPTPTPERVHIDETLAAGIIEQREAQTEDV